MSQADILREKLSAVRDRIQQACDRSHRNADSIELIAVTKNQPVEKLQALIDIGVSHLGENRVQEIVEKVPRLRGEFSMHFIGHLQTNKAAKVLPYIQTIQSIDRIRIIDRIEKYLPTGKQMPVLVEVNTLGEVAKNGCRPSECRMLIERLLAGGMLVPCGYMTIGPFGGDEVAARNSFTLLRECAGKNSDLVSGPHLSMGMSDDFEWAIEEGATMIRLGTVLLGARN